MKTTPGRPRAARPRHHARLIVQVSAVLLASTGLGTAFAARQMMEATNAAAERYSRERSFSDPRLPSGKSRIGALVEQSEQNARHMNGLLITQAVVSLLLAGAIYQGVRHEWTQQQKQEADAREINTRLQEQAETDALTGLKNRRAFEKRLQEEWARAMRYGHPLSLLLIDVDHFKRFNDTWGHLAGDDTLRQTALLLEAQSRSSDLVARYGGEEFTLLLPHTSEAAALLTADRIRAAFRRHSWEHEAITVSIGIASLAPETLAPTDLVHQADTALYWAKHQGRDRSVTASMA